MNLRSHPAPSYLLFGYDPLRDLPGDHLARLVDLVVEEVLAPIGSKAGPGQPSYDPRLCAKVLIYGYATGCRSSRQLERLCTESLPFLFLTRGDGPSYRTLCRFRVTQREQIEQIWISLFEVASKCGMERLGHLVVDSCKLRADASPEAVIQREEYGVLLGELEAILQEAAVVDTREEQEGRSGTTRTGAAVERDVMRDIVRRVRGQLGRARAAARKRSAHEVSGPVEGVSGPVEGGSGPVEGVSEPVEGVSEPARRAISSTMRDRIEQAVEAIHEAQEEERKHLCLTDPDARMMAGGRHHKVQECHSFEAGVDTAAGLLVVGQTTQATHDNSRLESLVEAAAAHEPQGVKAVDADSGFYAGDALARLLNAGIDTCVPDSNTAGDLHRNQPVGTIRELGRGQVPMIYDAAANRYVCPMGNSLDYRQTRRANGQTVRVYRAQESCEDCALASDCLRQEGAKHRMLKVAEADEILEQARKRFDEEAHRERYHHRGEAIETVFGFIRGTLGYNRWSLRGRDKVASEGALLKVAYQFRKIHVRWAVPAPG